MLLKKGLGEKIKHASIKIKKHNFFALSVNTVCCILISIRLKLWLKKKKKSWL